MHVLRLGVTNQSRVREPAQPERRRQPDRAVLEPRGTRTDRALLSQGSGRQRHLLIPDPISISSYGLCRIDTPWTATTTSQRRIGVSSSAGTSASISVSMPWTRALHVSSSPSAAGVSSTWRTRPWLGCRAVPNELGTLEVCDDLVRGLRREEGQLGRLPDTGRSSLCRRLYAKRAEGRQRFVCHQPDGVKSGPSRQHSHQQTMVVSSLTGDCQACGVAASCSTSI